MIRSQGGAIGIVTAPRGSYIRPMRSYPLDATWGTVLRDLHVAPADVLRRAGLPGDLLDNPSARLLPAEYYRFWSAVEALTGDPLLALQMTRAVTADALTPLAFAALCSPHMLAAAERVGRYKALVSPTHVGVRDDGAHVVVEFSWPAPPPPPTSLVLKELLVLVVLVRVATREPVRPVTVTTTVLPTPLAPYEEFLGTTLRRGPRHEVTFTRTDATRPFLTSDEAMWQAFQPALHRRLRDDGPPSTATRRVRAALFEALPTGLVTLEQVARRLGTSARTLQRQMEAEGTSFQRVLSETRATLARHYLESTALPTTEIALLLGYNEANSFSRAFKSWTGTTPGAVRRGSPSPLSSIPG